MLNIWYAGLNIHGETIIFNSLDAIDEEQIISYFEIEDEIPSGFGPLKTDGVSKLWREEEDIDTEKMDILVEKIINDL